MPEVAVKKTEERQGATVAATARTHGSKGRELSKRFTHELFTALKISSPPQNLVPLGAVHSLNRRLKLVKRSFHPLQLLLQVGCGLSVSIDDGPVDVVEKLLPCIALLPIAGQQPLLVSTLTTVANLSLRIHFISEDVADPRVVEHVQQSRRRKSDENPICVG